MRIQKSSFTLLSLFIGLLFISACQQVDQGLIIAQTFPVTGQEVGAYGFIGVAFSQAMEPESVEKAFSLSPSPEGEIFWQENNFYFRPIQALQRTTTYQATLQGEVSTLDGQTLPIDLTWHFTTREPDLLYFVPTDEFGEIWRSSSDGSQPQQLSQTDGNVLEFAPNRTGDQIVFSLQNGDGGRDLWLMDRNGANQQRFINCDMDFCDEPTWSMDQTQIAYTRQSYNPETRGYQPAQVWIASVDTAETSPFLAGKTGSGQAPSFSPDGERFAYYDTDLGGIHIIDIHTQQEGFVPSSVPDSGDWSPDGSILIFTNHVPAPHEPFIEVNVVNLDTLQVTPAFDQGVTDTDFSQPRWSPNDDWAAVSLRPVNSGISKALWVLRIGSTESRLVVDEPSATISSYRWDPWGHQLIYQRSDLNRSDPHISVWNWHWQTQGSTLIIENGGRAEWLP
jgi:Tol biopolymer transport system component